MPQLSTWITHSVSITATKELKRLLSLREYPIIFMINHHIHFGEKVCLLPHSIYFYSPSFAYKIAA